MAVGGLEVMEVLLMDADGFFQLLDVLSPAFSERGLRLTIPLLPLLRSSVDLWGWSVTIAHGGGVARKGPRSRALIRSEALFHRRTGLRPPLRLGC